jgi:hypothetical protein
LERRATHFPGVLLRRSDARNPTLDLMQTIHYKGKSKGKAVPLQAWSGPECSRKLRFSDNIKGKSVPLQVWSGPEVSRKLRSPDFVTKAQDGGKFISHTHRPHLPPGNSPVTHCC